MKGNQEEVHNFLLRVNLVACTSKSAYLGLRPVVGIQVSHIWEWIEVNRAMAVKEVLMMSVREERDVILFYVIGKHQSRLRSSIRCGRLRWLRISPSWFLKLKLKELQD